MAKKWNEVVNYVRFYVRDVKYGVLDREQSFMPDDLRYLN